MSTGITLITGATGHLGANLVRHLIAEGEQVRVMMRTQQDNGALEGLDIERVDADLRNNKEVSNAVRGCDHIYHCAALVSTIDGNATHKREIFDTNVLGTINILKSADLHNIKKVVVSGSLSATGYEPDMSSHEDMPFYPFDRHLPYGFTKHLTEHECLKAHANGLNVVIATSCAIIGPHDYVPSRMGRVLIDYANGSLRAYSPGGFEFVSSHDIAKGHILAMQHGRSGQKYIFGTAYASVDDLLSIFRDVTGCPLPRLRLPPLLMATLAEVADKTWYRAFPNRPRRFTPGAVRLLQMHRRASHDKAKHELGYQPTELSQAVREAYDDFVRRGLIVPAR